MLSDRELLVLAAKAAGYIIADWCETYHGVRPTLRNNENVGITGRWIWNPLDDDGDAFRLAAKLYMLINPCIGVVMVTNGDVSAEETTNSQDICTALRRAIVRAAAEIGKRMQS